MSASKKKKSNKKTQVQKKQITENIKELNKELKLSNENEKNNIIICCF